MGALLCAGCGILISPLPDLPVDAVEAEHRLQQIAELREYYTQLARVEAVAFRIRVANREFCENFGATTPTRFVQMREVAAEIADKRRRHLPLVPELKFKPEPVAA